MRRFPFLGLASQVALFLGQLLKGSVEGGFCGIIGLRDSPAGDKRFSRCAVGKTSDAPDHDPLPLAVFLVADDVNFQKTPK